VSTPSPVPSFKVANPLVTPVVSQLKGEHIILADGRPAGALTVQTTSATVIVMLSAEELDSWAAVITELAGQVRGPGLVRPTPADVTAVSKGNGKG